MRKFLLLITSLLLFIGLAACGSNDNNEENNEPANEESNEPNDDQTNESNNDENNVNDSSENNESDEEEAAHSELDEFDEGKVIQSQIDQVENLSMNIETDNDNNRVILFKNGDEAQYKSVYVKNDKHLKIIHLKEDDGLVFEGTIE